MTKKRVCKVCEEYSGKRNVCLKCKTEQPFKASVKGGEPFRRVKKEADRK